MRRERTRRRGADPCKSHRLFLLLFFLFGALLLRFWPPMRDMTGGAEKLLPCVLLLPALLGGSPCGLWLIPAAALWLGASAMLQLSAAGCFSELVPEIAPLLFVTPLFFLTGVCGMRLSEGCLSALTRGEPVRRRTLILGQSALWGTALAAGAFTYYLLSR